MVEAVTGSGVMARVQPLATRPPTAGHNWSPPGSISSTVDIICGCWVSVPSHRFSRTALSGASPAISSSVAEAPRGVNHPAAAWCDPVNLWPAWTRRCCVAPLVISASMSTTNPSTSARCGAAVQEWQWRPLTAREPLAPTPTHLELRRAMMPYTRHTRCRHGRAQRFPRR